MNNKIIINKDIIELGDSLFSTPELGYKEYRSKQIIVDYLTKRGFHIDNECFETAFSVSIGSGRPHIGLIAELDAIPTLGHPFANINDNNAAHACGHSTQCALMIGALEALNKIDLPQGTVTLFFTPAEEFTDIDYRLKLIEEKKINHIGGKINMLEAGMFDDVDCLIHAHSSSAFSYRYSIDSHLAGFCFKRITFTGKAAHAAIFPHEGRNALNAFVLFENAISLLRETFKEEDHNRIHGMIIEGGQTVNSIPERVTYDMYVRSMDVQKVLELSKLVDNAATHCAAALNCGCQISTTPGYLPLVQDKNINKVMAKNACRYCDITEIKTGEISMAASDLGDLSIFIPSVEIGYGGFSGVAHSKDFLVVDKDRVYLETADVIAQTVFDLLSDPQVVEQAKKDHVLRLSKEEYRKYLASK